MDFISLFTIICFTTLSFSGILFVFTPQNAIRCVTGLLNTTGSLTAYSSNNHITSNYLGLPVNSVDVVPQSAPPVHASMDWW